MNSLPLEVRTPPLPVIAFIGCPELQKDVGLYLNQNVHPPFLSVGLAEANEGLLLRLCGAERARKPFSTPVGILKADWVSKQRQRRPAVAVAFVTRREVDGDPSSWLHMLSGLRSLRAFSARKGVQLLVVVVQDGPLSELPPDRVAGLCSNLELDQRHLCLISRQLFEPQLEPEVRQQLQAAQLGPLCELVRELRPRYYTSAADRLRQRQLDLSSSLGSCPPELSAATAFKLAVLAEFRQDWRAAVISYQAASVALRAVPLGRPSISCQRHAEVTAVAEVVHFKALMLLLHQQRYKDAVQQLSEHLAAFGPLPGGLPPAAAAAHYGWLSRQYRCAAEVIASSRIDQTTLQATKEMSPCCLLLSAALAAISRQALAEQLPALSAGGPPSFDVSRVHKGRYLGQLALTSPDASRGQPAFCDLTDAQFCEYLAAEEGGFNHQQVVMDLLTQAQHELRKEQQTAATCVQPDRLQARLSWLMAEQCAEANNLTAARKLLLFAAHVYRRDGWDVLLLQCLLLLRRVCQRLKLPKEVLLHSLEIACLAGATLGKASAPCALPAAGGAHDCSLGDEQQVQALAAAAVAGLLSGAVDGQGGILKKDVTQQSQGQSRDSSGQFIYIVQQLDLQALLRQQEQQHQPQQPDDVSAGVADALLQYHQQDFGWWDVLTVAGGLTAQIGNASHLSLCLALYSQLPVALPLVEARITLTDSQGSWVQPVAGGAPPQPQQQQPPDAASQQQHSGQQQHAGSSSSSWPLQLQPHRWQLLHAELSPRCVGSVCVESLQLQLSDRCCVDVRVSSFPHGQPALGRPALPPGVVPLPVHQLLRPGRWAAKVPHLGPPPRLQVSAPELLLAGEFVLLEVQLQVSMAQAAASLELSVRPALGPGSAAITLLAQSGDGTLQELNTTGSHAQLAVPELQANSSFKQQLWMRSAAPCSAQLVIMLACPTGQVVPHSEDLLFVAPFEHVARLSAEMGVQTLLAPAPGNSTGDAAAADELEPRSLPVGQLVIAEVLLRVPHSGKLLLLGAELQLQQESGLQVMNNISDQLRQWPLEAGGGSVCCLLLQLMPLRQTSSPVSIGDLTLRWRRRTPADAGAGGAVAAAEVATCMRLPRVIVQDALLSARVLVAPTTTQGVPFPLTMQVSNSTSLPQEVQVAVQEAPGVVLSGDKQQLLTLMPRATSSIGWSLVAHVPGQLLLPRVTLSSARFSCHAVTQAHHIQVMPF